MKKIKGLIIAFCGLALVTACQKEVAVSGLSINPSTVTMSLGETRSLSAIINPDNATNKKILWTSNGSFIATVDANGTVTAVGAGTTTISAITEDKTKSATCTVTVTVPVTGVTLNKTGLDIRVGDEFTLKAMVAPSNATNTNVSWKSGDPSVATVDNTGKVTAVKEGMALIQVTTEDGGKTALCVVTTYRSSTEKPSEGIPGWSWE